MLLLVSTKNVTALKIEKKERLIPQQMWLSAWLLYFLTFLFIVEIFGACNLGKLAF